ncbi:MAG: GH3 auxin-responsive promoter family protein [Bacteroidota bacterium]|nr:GH3 auxin-responsive promoter family protein [Bacteroidota bacterium]
MKLPFKNSFLSWVLKKRMHQIDFFLKYPIAVQKEVLSELLETAKNTVFSEEYDFPSINSYDEFRKRVPIRNYEDIFPFIKRLRNGEENILWPGKTKWFAKSSGTTNAKSKFIPFTEDALFDCHYKAGKDMLAIYCNNNPQTKVFDGKGLMLGGSMESNSIADYTDGDLSALLIDNFPFWINIHRIPDLETALHSNWEEKLEKIVTQSIEEDVTNLTGASSWMLIVLNQILEKTKANNILEVWPNLELYMHGGMNFSPYKSQFKKIIPNEKMNYMESYNASEGYFAIQDQPNSNELLLMLDYGIFYEFIPINEFNKGGRDAISLESVEINKTYAIVISTNAGLWRYLIGDTIKFTSLNPYRVKVVGRTKSFINAFGEELVIENAEDALAFACRKTSAVVKEFTVAPIYINNGESGAHQWLIEFTTLPIDLDIFTKLIDDYLQKVNTDYKAKRTHGLILQKPKIECVKNNTFYKWLNIKGKLGGQNKVPRLSNNREFAEEILLLT